MDFRKAGKDEWLAATVAAGLTKKMKSPEWLVPSGLRLGAWLTRNCGLDSDKFVLDLGCGFGRLAIGLSAAGVKYRGYDVQPRCIAFNRKLFFGSKTHQFELCNVRNDHYYKQGGSPREFHLKGIADNSVDAITCVSLFTHFPEAEDVENYIDEIHRVLKPGGFLYTTWLLDPPWMRQKTNAARAVYRLPEVERFLAGFESVPNCYYTELDSDDKIQPPQYKRLDRKM